MKSNNTYSKFAAIILAGTLAACSATSNDDKAAQLTKLKADQAELAKKIATLEEEIEKETPDSLKNVNAKEVSVTALSKQKFDHYVQTQGSVEAEDNILVSAQTMGVVTAVYVTEGQQVSKGQVLAQIDNSVILRGIEAQK
jgi:multidrug efflux pump subunit AcrA (membrane-fusion protein)